MSQVLYIRYDASAVRWASEIASSRLAARLTPPGHRHGARPNSAKLSAGCPVGVHQRAEVVEANLRGDVAGVRQTRGTAGGAPALAGHPDGRMRLLDRRHSHPGLVHAPVSALEGDLLPGPEELHQLDGLGHARHPVLPGGADGLQLRLPVPQANAQGEPSLADVVQSHSRLGDVNGVVQREQDDACQEPHVPRLRRQPAQQRDGVRPRRRIRDPVLGHRDGGKSGVPGYVADLHHLIDLLVQGTRPVRHEGAQVEPELHELPWGEVGLARVPPSLTSNPASFKRKWQRQERSTG